MIAAAAVAVVAAELLFRKHLQPVEWQVERVVQTD